MYESHFNPAYALKTAHPYAQYTGDVTYPGPTIMAVGSTQFTKEDWWKVGVGALGGGVLLYLALMWMKKLR